MNYKRRLEIREFARGVYSKLELSFPFSINEVLKKLGGEFRVDPDLFYKAKIENKGDESFSITIKSEDDSIHRYLFAHQLGHLFIHMGYLVDEAKWKSIKEFADDYGRDGYGEEENEANAFADEFVLPEEEFRDFIDHKAKDGKINIASMAENFMVHEGAVLNRGKWLGIFEWD